MRPLHARRGQVRPDQELEGRREADVPHQGDQRAGRVGSPRVEIGHRAEAGRSPGAGRGSSQEDRKRDQVEGRKGTQPQGQHSKHVLI